MVAKLGEGGMGEVYRATDTTLGRQVAIKVVSDAFAVDADRVARFEREARTLASLSHPNIAAVFGFEKAGSVHAAVWAFGCVLYEMLTGRRAFEDEDVSLTLSKLLRVEPEYDALPANVPPRVVAALKACLRKDPKQRAADIDDVRLALDGGFESTPTTTVAADSGTTMGPGLVGRRRSRVARLRCWVDPEANPVIFGTGGGAIGPAVAGRAVVLATALPVGRDLS